MTAPDDSRIRWFFLVAGLGLALVFHLGAWGGLTGFAKSMDFNQALFEDFSGPYFEQGRAWLSGETRLVRGFLYTPFFAVWMTILAATGHGVAVWVWLAVLLVAGAILVAVGPLARRSAGLPALGPGTSMAYGLFAGVSLPFLHGLHWGQVSAPLTACMACGCLAVAGGRSILGGALIGAAGAIKGYPLILVLLLVARRDWRGGASAVASLLLLGALVPILAIGPGATWRFYSDVGSVLGQLRSTEWDTSVASQFTGAVLSRAVWLSMPSWAARWGSLLLGAATIGWILRLTINGSSARDFLRASAAMLCMLPLLLQPAWPHYLAWLPLAQVLAWSNGAGSIERMRRVCAILSASVSSAFLFRWIGDYEVFYGRGLLCLASLVLLPALLLGSRQLDDH